MARRSLVRTHSSQLLKTLLNNPELPTFVERMHAPTLNKLIERVGLEDAGPLISLTTDRQLRSILDESLWTNLTPGKPEVHRPEEFIRWLEVLHEQGDEFLAERLIGLGADYVVLNFAQLVSVDDKRSILFSTPNAFAEEFGSYLVTALYDDEWDITRTAIAALHAEYPDFLEHILSRCSHDPERPGVAQANLMHDITGDRRDARETVGFVTPESAAAFLTLAKRATRASLIGGENHDAVSARYFARLQPGSFEGTNEPMHKDPEQDHTPDTKKLRELEDTLIQAEIVSNEYSGLLLAAPDRDGELPVKAALDGLQHTHPGLFGERLSELVYLSNVLMTGTVLDGQRITEIAAARAVLATCNVGMTYLGEGIGDDRAVREGLVRLFRIGWQILQEIPTLAGDRLVNTLRSAEMTKRLSDRAWILAEVDSTLDEFIDHVRHLRFAEVKDALFFISLVIEQEACNTLQALISDFPRYPLDGNLRPVESMDDITNIGHYLGSLANYAKL